LTNAHGAVLVVALTLCWSSTPRLPFNCWSAHRWVCIAPFRVSIDP